MSIVAVVLVLVVRGRWRGIFEWRGEVRVWRRDSSNVKDLLGFLGEVVGMAAKLYGGWFVEGERESRCREDDV